MTDSAVEVSIIVPAYNAGGFLADALDRLLQQTHPALQIVVVDDGSSDDTASVAERYAARDNRVDIVALTSNVGVARAREQGVLASRGEFLWFVDADDQWSDRAVESMLAAARRHSADVVIAGADYVFPDGRRKRVGAELSTATISPVDGMSMFLTGRITGHLWNKLFRRSLASEIDYTPAKVHSDQAMAAQLIAAARSITAIETIVYHYVLRQGSIVRSGTGRRESLVLVTDAVTDAARKVRPALLDSPEYAYYRLWFVALSSMKDATSGAYSQAEATQQIAAARRNITPAVLVQLARRKDLKRFALAFSAKTSVPLYRLVMSRGSARA